MIYRTIEENLHFINSWCKKVRWTQYPSIRRSLLRDEWLCNFCSWCNSFCLQSYGWKQSRKLNRDFQICCFSLSTRISEASKYQSKLSVLLDMNTQMNHRWAGTWVRLVGDWLVLFHLAWIIRSPSSLYDQIWTRIQFNKFVEGVLLPSYFNSLIPMIWLLILPSGCYTFPCKLVTRIWC